MTATARPAAGSAIPRLGRWWQLALGVTCMAMIANLQYGWTLFVNPIEQKFHWGLVAIQWAFTLFVLSDTWLVPLEGYLVDRYGPRIVTLGGGVLVAISWVMNAYADSLSMLYAGAIVGGMGAGAVYGTCVGNAIRWFPDRRGLAAGLTAMGFGAGSALTVVPISFMIQTSGYEATFFWFGIGQGAVVFLLGWLLRAPEPAELVALPRPSARAVAWGRDHSPLEMVRTPVFWLMYAMFVLMAAGGLMATAQLAPIAKAFGVAEVPVSILGLTLPALTFALSLNSVLNGVTRPVFGWISDRLGRENTMFVAFSTEALGILLLSQFGENPVAFVFFSGLMFFAWGEIYSLFPSTCGDTYGSRYASTNTGVLYTAKGTAALLVPLASVVAARGGWQTVFVVAAVMNFAAAFLALFALKPLRARMSARGAAAERESASRLVAAAQSEPVLGAVAKR